MCKEPLAVFQIVIYTRKDFYLLDELNQKIDILAAAGLIDYWRNQDFDFHNITTAKTNYPEPLTIAHLSGCFTLWVWGCSVSFIIFIVESICFKLA